MLKDFSERFLSIVFPVECETCGVALPPLPRMGICEACQHQVKSLEAPHCLSCGRGVAKEGTKCGECFHETFHFDRAFACSPYEGKMKELLHTYKFGRRRYLKNFLIHRMEKFYNEHMNHYHFDAIAAVPVDQKRRLSRGFNQSELLAKGLSKKIALPHISNRLRRIDGHGPQSLLSKEKRKQNVKGSFAILNKKDPLPKRILLVDDILTTGQTTSECAKALKTAGADYVAVLACARGI